MHLLSDSIKSFTQIVTLAKKYSCPSGFSDHSLDGSSCSCCCLGACIVEKHFTSNRNLPGPDQWFSSTPDEFSELVRRVREAEIMLGCGDLKPTLAESKTRESFRLSCVSAHDLPAGVPLKRDDIVFQRPASGLPPKSLVCYLEKN